MMSIEQQRRLMTPSGRPPVVPGMPRPPGPLQNLVPLAPPHPPPPSSWTAGGPPHVRAVPLADVAPLPPQSMITAMPRLGSPVVQATNQLDIPWQQLIINLWRLTQPTGVTPGTFAGLTVNAFGQVTSATSTGATFEDVVLTGSPTAPTPNLNDRSNRIATTAFVKDQGYATQDFVTGQGFATQTFVLSQGFIHEAPNDGRLYARNGQTGQWVAVAVTPLP